MRQRRAIYTSVLLLLVITTRPVHAQSADRDFLDVFRSDSTAWQRVLTFVVHSLSTELVRAGSDTAKQPWELRLPQADPQRPLLERQLRTILRARPITPTDRLTHLLEVGELKIVNDTAMVVVRVQETQRCADTTRTTGFGWMDTVRVRRFPPQQLWGVGFSRGTLHGDRLAC